MAIEPGLKFVTIAAGATRVVGTQIYQTRFTNKVTIRRFQISGGDQVGSSSPTLLLNIDDAGLDGQGTTAIADRSAAALADNEMETLEANNSGGSDGYVLPAGHILRCTVTTAGSSNQYDPLVIVAEIVEGVG